MKKMKTGMGRKALWRWLALAGVGLLVATTLPEARTAAPAGSDATGTEETPGVVQPIGEMQAAAANRRTIRQMQNADIAESTRWEPEDAGEGRAIPFRSTLDADTYRTLKGELASERLLGPVSLAAPPSREALLGLAEALAPSADEAPEPLAPPPFLTSCSTGADQFGTIRPPDTHGAIGNGQFVEIVNSRLHVFNRLNCAVQLNVSLNAFFGIPAGQPILFDPRAVYDATWDRWVLSAEQFPLSVTDQRQIIAISTGPNALGPYFVYNFNVHFFPPGPDFFWDFPQLGMNQDAVIITANIFNPGFAGSATFAVAKARLYNGLGFGVPLFFLPASIPALVAPSLAPPIVLDQNANAILVSAAPVDNEIRRYTLVNPCCPPNQFLAGPVSIPVPAYTVPANACQPGMADRLDTLDARFQNASTQVGSLLYNVHTIALGPFPTPRWYRINTTTNTLASPADFFFESLVSHDFNPSIAANAIGDVFVTWSTTDCGVRGEGGHHARIRWSGDDFPLPIDIGPGFSLFTSPVGYNPSTALDERWGDYSAVSIDPLNQRRAWIVNEKINAPAVWGSRFVGVGFVP